MNTQTEFDLELTVIPFGYHYWQKWHLYAALMICMILIYRPSRPRSFTSNANARRSMGLDARVYKSFCTRPQARCHRAPRRGSAGR